MNNQKQELENRILQNQLLDFLDSYGIKEKNLSVAFEHFCNYCIFSHKYPEAYITDGMFYQAVHTGKGGDFAVDGILIIINDTPVTTLTQAKELIFAQKRFTANFLFVQAKTSATFDSGEMLKVGYGIKKFFTDKDICANQEVKEFKLIADYVFENSVNFVENPTCSIYYVTTGKWTKDEFLIKLIEEERKNIELLNYFSDVKYTPIDALHLQTIYKEINNSITRQVVIPKIVAFPEIDGVVQAYLGLIPFGEYIKLITDDSEGLLQGIFYDNVRGYLGENPVNKEIIATVENTEKYVQFPILNNGITIVTKTMNSSGDKFKLTDYQIVNGCQTSHVLYKCRDRINTDMMIPIKIVNTISPELVNNVIRSTNRQTQVLDEAFESLKEFHKQLQEYYETYSGEDRLYYERRSHEFDEEKRLRRYNVITLPVQLQAFMSMFLEEPHSMHRYYGELLRANKNRLFQNGHQLIAYYTSAKTLQCVEKALNNGSIDMKWRYYRYHILLLIQTFLRKINGIKFVPAPTSKDMNRFCTSILKIVNDEKNLDIVLQASIHHIDKTLEEQKSKSRLSNGPERTKEFTMALLANVDQTITEVEKWNKCI
ncbi:MAG: AIPR family protein [Alistipes sp.]|nr:AIPR family protein [Alistipes sp.]